MATAEYRVKFRENFAVPENWREILMSFVGQEEILWTKGTKKGFRTLDMKPLIYSFSCPGDEIHMCVCSRVGENLRPEQIIGEAFRSNGIGFPEDALSALRIHRTDLLAEREKTAETAEREKNTGQEQKEAEERGSGQQSFHDGKAAGLLSGFISLNEMGRVIWQEET